MNQNEIDLFLAFYFYLLTSCKLTMHHANTSTASANFDAKIAAVVHHCTDGDLRTTALSCTSATHRKNQLTRYPKRNSRDKRSTETLPAGRTFLGFSVSRFVKSL